MGTTTEELKKLYAKLGGTDPNIPKASTPGEVLNGINELELGGDKLPEVTEADNGKALGVKQGKWDKMDVDIELPDVTTDDNGKVLMVSEGNWGKSDLPSELPAVTSADNGNVLTVVEGAWAKSVASGKTELFGFTEQYGVCFLSDNKSITDLQNCVDNGKIPVLFNGGKVYYPTKVDETAAVQPSFIFFRFEKTDTVIYYISVMITNDITSRTKGVIQSVCLPYRYSTTEHIVGKWIDGDTNVYERSYHVEDLTGAPADWESMFEVNVADIVHTEGSAHKSNGEIISIENTGFRVCANPQVHPGYMCYHFTDATVTSFTVTIQYTKAS